MHRRSVLTALTAGGTLGLLTACGGDEDTAGGASTSSSTAVSDGTFPVTVDHKFGSTEIPSQPERVVTVGFNEQDFVLALGITPVGTREYLSYDYQQRPWAVDLLPADPIPEVGGTELNVEAVAALDPDLVVGTYSFIDETVYAQLSEIAPTIGDLDTTGETSGASWQEQLSVIGRALGRSEEAQALTEEVEDAFATAAAEHPEFAEKVVSVLLVLETSYYLLDADDPRARFFLDLGFQPNPTTGEVSAEQASTFDTDVLVVLGATPQDFAADGVTGALAAVTEGRALYVAEFDSDFAGALGFSSPLSLPYALDLAVPALAAVSDGDPSTVPATL